VPAALVAGVFATPEIDPVRDESILTAVRFELDGSSADLDIWPRASEFLCRRFRRVGDRRSGS